MFFSQDDIGSVTDLASMAGDQAHADLTEGNEETPLASGILFYRRELNRVVLESLICRGSRGM